MQSPVYAGTPGERCCPVYIEANWEWWAMALSDGPENFPSGSHASFTAGEINRH